MKRIVSTRERLSSAWLSRLRWSSRESTSLYTTQRSSVLRHSGHSRHISSQRVSRAQHWRAGIPPDHARYDHKLRYDDGTVAPTATTQASTNGALVVPQMYEEEHTSPAFYSPQEEAEHAARFYRTVEEGQPDCLMTAMIDPRSAGLVGSLPQTTFLEALHRLSPTHFVEPFRDLHHPLHSWTTLLEGLKRLEVHFDDFTANLLTIVGYRAPVQPLQLAEYTHLLDCARSMGNAPFAKEIWESMQRREIAPNTACYNHYMEALVWDHCYSGAEAYNLRITPHSYRKRRKGAASSVGWRGFGTGHPNSVRHAVLEIFQTMLREGHLPDERTYINILIAGARVGHNKGMRLVLKTVWNIDMKAMRAEEDSSKLPPLTPYDPWSALYPTENLLFAIAHAFGTNNDIPSAIRVIQHISTTYNVPITEKVWTELLKRAYILCRAKMTDNDSENAKFAGTIGRVPMDLVQSLFGVLTSAPYNFTPSLQACRYMLNISMHNGNLEECKMILRGSYKVLQEARKKQTEARKAVLRLLLPLMEAAEERVTSGHPIEEDLFACPMLADAIQAYDLLRLEEFQKAYQLRRCCWSVLKAKGWNDTPDHVWRTQEIPKILEEWEDFLPDMKNIYLGEQSGMLTIKGKTRLSSRNWNCDPRRIPVRRLANKKKLFVPAEPRRLAENTIWFHVRQLYASCDRKSDHLKRLFWWQVPRDPELQETITTLRNTWTEYPDDSPWGPKNRPAAGFYGRLAALGMLKTEQRGIYYLSEGSLV